MRYIALPAINKRVSLKAYVAAIRAAKANPEAELKHALTCWWSCTGADIMQQFREGVADRINQAIPYLKRK